MTYIRGELLAELVEAARYNTTRRVNPIVWAALDRLDALDNCEKCKGQGYTLREGGYGKISQDPCDCIVDREVEQ